MRVYWIESGPRSGTYNMALDEALLETLRKSPEPLLIVRTYQWEVPTLSLGVNQAVRDIDFLLSFYGGKQHVRHVVRRPTGGRAILHGEDISFSFVTNQPDILRQPLKEAYALFAGIVRSAMRRLDLPVRNDSEAGDRDYVRSPICFETHTASDLLNSQGDKLAGSAQLRRAGGLLQHGAAFLKPYGISSAAFHHALTDSAGEAFSQRTEALELTPFDLKSIEALLCGLESDYRKSSGEILASASTTAGSHLAPASF